MSQLNNNSFSVVDTFLKDGYKVVGKWSKGVILQKDKDIQLVPSVLTSRVGCKAKCNDVANSKSHRQINEELFKLYKAGLATEAQVKTAVQGKDECRDR